VVEFLIVLLILVLLVGVVVLIVERMNAGAVTYAAPAMERIGI
jgi:hypothetical protein